jgi:ArsR family transcriptional regulator, arsenate/arsenite/antimonite-responsive transcriptional repressor
VNTTYVGYINVFKPFCDEKRLRILELLQSGEKCACELLEDLDIGQSSLSYHMKILVESGVVESWNEGKWTHYSISKKGINYAVELLNILTTTDTKNSNDNSCKC